MIGKTAAVTQGAGIQPGVLDSYDILIFDAAYRQSLVSARSLGRFGLRVAMAESYAQYDPSLPVPAFRSRHSSRNVVFPSYATDPVAFASAVVDFVREHPTRVALPTSDGVIEAMVPYRERLAELGCTLALAADCALEIANDKDRTLELARKLDISQPRTMRIDSIDDLPAVLAEFAFPFVLKPNTSWSRATQCRLVPTEVINHAEAVDVTRKYLAGGTSVLAQEWACGRREGLTLFVVGGEVLASCAHVEYRTSPALGGASVMRESTPIPEDIYVPAMKLVAAAGLEGVCEVEFRRDAAGRPLLMEINARLVGGIENAMHSGVDFPLLIWQWATGLPIDRVEGHRTGIRTRWLHGDLRWLRDNYGRVGRPDSVSRSRALWMFASEFVRTRHYDCFDPRDLRPIMTDLRNTATIVLKSRTPRTPSAEPGPKGV